jgi:hypothetical protein
MMRSLVNWIMIKYNLVYQNKENEMGGYVAHMEVRNAY